LYASVSLGVEKPTGSGQRGRSYLHLRPDNARPCGNIRQKLITASFFSGQFVLALNPSPALDEGQSEQGRVGCFTPHRADTQNALTGETAAD
jgi:hypothetical protein